MRRLRLKICKTAKIPRGRKKIIFLRCAFLRCNLNAKIVFKIALQIFLPKIKMRDKILPENDKILLKSLRCKITQNKNLIFN